MNHLTFERTPSFSLENFEGSLELLLHLIQKQEMNVCDVSVQKLTKQLLDILEASSIEINAELMGVASTLLLIKSQKLFPAESPETKDALKNSREEIIEKLIEYCHFRDTAKTLLSREQEQKAYYPRALPTLRKELGTGLEEVKIEDLKQLLTNVIKRSKKHTRLITEEKWHVVSKINWFKNELKVHHNLPFDTIFCDTKCREELIVSFLALLELMKLQELKVVRENHLLYIIRSYEPKSS